MAKAKAKAKQRGAAAPESNKGLVITLVFFILATIGLGVGTYMGYIADEGKDAAIKKEKQNVVVLEKERDWERFKELLFLSYLGYLRPDDQEEFRSKLEKFGVDPKDGIGNGELGKDQKDHDAVVALIKDKFQKRLPLDPVARKINGNFEALLVAEAKRYDVLEKQIAGFQTGRDKAERRAKDADAEKAADKKGYDEELVKLKQKLEDNQAVLLKQVDDFKKDLQKLADEKEALVKQMAEDQKKAQTELGKRDAMIRQQKELIGQQSLEMAALRQKGANEAPKSWRTDWKIVSLDPRGSSAYINLGSADNVKPQLTFTVHGVGPDGKPEQAAKATLEVVNVLGEHYSQARITGLRVQRLDRSETLLPPDQVVPARDRVLSPVAKGDVLYNAVWSPGLKKHVAVAGIVDLGGEGRNSMAEFIRHLERQNVVVDAYLDPVDLTPRGPGITVQTDYLILGGGVELLPEAAQREGYAKKLQEGIDALRQQAKNSGVKEVNLRQYLDQIGYRLPSNGGSLSPGYRFTPPPPGGAPPAPMPPMEPRKEEKPPAPPPPGG
jgi:hypothetical protein